MQCREGVVVVGVGHGGPVSVVNSIFSPSVAFLGCQLNTPARKESRPRDKRGKGSTRNVRLGSFFQGSKFYVSIVNGLTSRRKRWIMNLINIRLIIVNTKRSQARFP
jgi:hypothetical protein